MRLPVTTHDLDSPESTAKLVNCYVENLPADARAPYVIRRCPGFGLGDDLFSGPIEALTAFPNTDYLILAQPTSLQFFSPNLVTLTDTATLGGGRKDFATGASSIVMVDAPDAYNITWDGSSFTATKISDADFTSRGAGDVEFLDNYFLFREPGTARFFGSDVGSATAYTSTSFATAENQGDLLVGIKATNANILLFGQETIEIWDAVGGSGFPFRRIINGSIDKGCANGATIAEIDDRVLWVADDRTVRTLSGMEPVKVSNFAIDKYLQQTNSIASGKAFTYSHSGHNYYVLRFSDRCFVYDLTLGAWHERKTIGLETWAWGSSAKLRGNQWFGQDIHAEAITQDYHLVRLSDDIYYEMDNVNATDVPMVSEWTYQPVWGAGQRVFHDRLEIVVETGVGNSNSTDPVISLELSDDGGRTWHEMPNRAMGSQGERFQRVVWHNLGSSYQRVYRASCSDPVPLRVMDTQLYAKGGRV